MSENSTPSSKENQTEPDAAQLPINAENKSMFTKLNEKTSSLESLLNQKDEEIANLKTRLFDLEAQVVEVQKIKAQRTKDNQEVEVLKNQSEEILTKAKSMLFDKTKIIKNQELQIEALNQQVSSLKDVLQITKDLLEIRNLEVKQLETKIKCMEDKVNAEKERQDLMHKKLEQMIRFNGDLKREYETQLCLFSALRERYNEKELARGVVENLRQNGNTQNGPSTSSQTDENPTNEPDHSKTD